MAIAVNHAYPILWELPKVKILLKLTNPMDVSIIQATVVAMFNNHRGLKCMKG